jgi:hypothetical protein
MVDMPIIPTRKEMTKEGRIAKSEAGHFGSGQARFDKTHY